MSIQHNHAYEYMTRGNTIDCPRYRLERYARELLVAAENVFDRLPELKDYPICRELQAVIDKHNHPDGYMTETCRLYCPRCRLEAYAEDLLVAAEKLLIEYREELDGHTSSNITNTQAIIEKIRGGK